MDYCPFCGAETRPSNYLCWNCGNHLMLPIPYVRYHILEEVGQGGMGKIYKAQDIKLGKRLVAIKELKMPGLQSQEENERASRLFEQEALLLAKLNHPSLPNIYDHFSQDEHWYFVMEYIAGQTLTQRLHNTSGMRLPPDDVLSIGIKLCSVLGYLHSQTPPIIYGDLKPDNIILTTEGDLYLIDFGIARLFGETHTDDWKFVSPGYSPPEQYQNAHISPRADIYSLGATLYQLLSGRHPPTAKADFAPLQLGHQLWMVDLEALIMSMVEQDQQKRQQDVNVVKQALQRIAAQKAQELNTLQNFPLWSTETSTWGIPNSSETFSSIETPALPTSVTSRDIQLSLDRVDALAWSPGGAYLAAVNNEGEVHIYTWPPEEKFYNSSSETLIPLRIWSLKEKQSVTSKSKAIAWSPDATRLAVAAGAKLFILDILSKNSPSTYTGHKGEITAIAWSPNGKFIASVNGNAYTDSHVRVWAVNTKRKVYEYHGYGLNALAWSPNSIYLAFAMRAATIQAPDSWAASPPIPSPEWKDINATIQAPDNLDAHLPLSDPNVSSPLPSPKSGRNTSLSDIGILVFKAANGSKVYQHHHNFTDVYDVVWSSKGTNLVSCTSRGTIHIWDPKSAQQLHSLEGHTDAVMRITFLDHGRLLASLSTGGDIYIWRTDTWAQVEAFKPSYPSQWDYNSTRLNYTAPSRAINYSNMAFHSANTLIATFGDSGVVRLYEIDAAQFYADSSKVGGLQYTNAKVILLGDSGVGKSGLGLVLSRQRFVPTESTHGRVVWTFSRQESKLPDGRKEIRETLLWDLAGQPGYRLVHQLHLSEVTVALVVFDAHSETDPFAGISHWVRALRTAQRVRGSKEAMKMLLVLARVDRSGKRVSRSRIDEIVQGLGFDGYFETSAKENTNIAELAGAIEKAVNWEQLPKVTSTELFQRIRTFLIAEKQAGRLLSTADDLYRAFLRTWSPWGEKDLSAEFATGIRLLESTDLIRQLSFGSLVLLQPELLDTYASALVNAVRDEPDGLGSISEEDVHAAAFPIPKSERIADPEQEKLLLIAMVKDLLFYEIALREQGEDGPYLVFPSESTRENPALPDPENASVVFTFEGPVLNIYATLAVRLSHSGLFSKKELWKNAVIYDARVGGICGMWLKVIEDGKGELTLFFEEHASEETRFHFEEYVRVHLQRKALPESSKSRRIHRCDCGFVASDQLVRMRTGRDLNWFNCPNCEKRVDMRDHGERLRSVSPSRVLEMDRAADMQRTLATAQATVQGKQETNDFDVFLCYNEADRAAIINLGERLKEQGLLPWLDVWELRPGLPWQRVLESQIGQIKSVAIFVGQDGIGPWEQMELEAFLREFVQRKCPVIPVILANAPKEPQLPVFLRGMTWVDFRKQDPDPMNQLSWGITGKRRPLR